jgi:hypothetical protein
LYIKNHRDLDLSFLSRLEIFEALPEEDVILLLRVIELVSLGPVVGDGVSEDLFYIIKLFGT